MHYGWDGHMWGMGWMWLLWALILVGVIVFVVWMARTLGQTPPSGGSSYPRAESAEDILRQRYARGEIDRDEFEERMDDLRRHGGASTA